MAVFAATTRRGCGHGPAPAAISGWSRKYSRANSSTAFPSAWLCLLPPPVAAAGTGPPLRPYQDGAGSIAVPTPAPRSRWHGCACCRHPSRLSALADKKGFWNCLLSEEASQKPFLFSCLPAAVSGCCPLCRRGWPLLQPMAVRRRSLASKSGWCRQRSRGGCP